MPYYPTLAEDLARARAILEKGRPTPEDFEHFDALPQEMQERALAGGRIFADDIHAAYKLLESFVAAIEAVDPKVCELALRHQHPSITCPTCQRTSYHPKDISERYCGACHRFHDEMPAKEQP